MFIAVKNNEVEVAGAETENQGAVSNSSVVDKVITSPKITLQIIYVIIGIIVLLALCLFVSMKPKNLHTKNVVYLVLLIILIAAFIYLTSSFLYPHIIIE